MTKVTFLSVTKSAITYPGSNQAVRCLSRGGLLRRYALHNDIEPYCLASEAIALVIASEAKQSPLICSKPDRPGECFVAALLAMTLVVPLRAKRMPPCPERSTVERGEGRQFSAPVRRLPSVVCCLSQRGCFAADSGLQ